MSKRNLRGFRYQQLEDRRLLAADFATEVFDCAAAQPEQCEIAPVETTEEVNSCVSAIITEEVEVETELPADQVDAVINEVESELEETNVVTEVVDEVETEVDAELELEPEVEGEIESEVEDEPTTIDEGEDETESTIDTDLEIDPIEVTELGDPVESTLGHFGDLNAETMKESLSFAPSQDGMIDLAIASSNDEALPQIEVVDAQGNAIELSANETVGGFQLLSFEATEAETYQLSVSHAEAYDDFFLVTVDFEEIPEPVDLHADEMGESSTPLEFVDNQAQLEGMLETAGDIDTFQFASETDGKASLNIRELIAENSTELDVTVYDADGNAISHGATNETAMISFDVAENGTYFVAITANADQVGEYKFGLDITPDEVVVVDDHANEVGPDATELTFEESEATATGELESTEDQDAFQFVSPIDGEAVVSVDANSEGHASDAIVSVFESTTEPAMPTELDELNELEIGPAEESSNDLVVAGTTNESVSLRFDVNSGNEYQLLVDSINDVETSYELTVTLIESVTDPIDPVATTEPETTDEGEIGNVDPVVGEEAVDDFVSDMNECFDVADVDLSENEELDNIFQGFGDELQSESDLGRNRFFGKRLLPWFRQV